MEKHIIDGFDFWIRVYSKPQENIICKFYKYNAQECYLFAGAVDMKNYGLRESVILAVRDNV